MSSKRRQEGYLVVDSGGGPGIAPDELARRGLNPEMGRGLFESPTITCSHCQRIVILNPGRTRERGYCQKCDHYVCDQCNLARVQTGVCVPFMAKIEQQHEVIVVQDQQRAILGL
jgi:hypothetical protein